MDILVECSPDSASIVAGQLAKNGCEFKSLTPKNMGALELVTTILLPTTLTAIQIAAQLWLELKQKNQPITIIVDGKEFMPSKENLAAIEKNISANRP